MSANTELMEHRWGVRVQLDAPADFEVAGTTTRVSISNASLSGAFVRTRLRLPLLSTVAVRALDSEDWLEACVVRHDYDGMGLEWLDPGLRAVCELLSLRRNAPTLPVARPAASITHLPARQPESVAE